MRVILVLTAMLGLSLAFEDKTVFQYLVDTPGYGTLESLLRATGLDNVLTSVGKCSNRLRIPISVYKFNLAMHSPDKRQLKTLILLTNVDQKSLETEFSIAFVCLI